MSDYIFNPIEYGYESISNFPELAYLYNVENKRTFIKITAYSNMNGLCYWFSAVRVPSGSSDDRVRIESCSHDTRLPNTYEKQNKPNTVYFGLISSDYFAKALLKNLLGTTKNKSANKEGAERLKWSLNEEMRREFNL